MLSKQAVAVTAIPLLAPGAKADTAGATGAWTDVSKYKGELMFVIHTGTVTAGQVAWVIQDATDDQGAGAATLTMTEGAWTTVTTSNDPMIQKRSKPATATRGFVRVVGTVTTGPVDAQACVFGLPS